MPLASSSASSGLKNMARFCGRWVRAGMAFHSARAWIVCTVSKVCGALAGLRGNAHHLRAGRHLDHAERIVGILHREGEARARRRRRAAARSRWRGRARAPTGARSPCAYSPRWRCAPGRRRGHRASTRRRRRAQCSGRRSSGCSARAAAASARPSPCRRRLARNTVQHARQELVMPPDPVADRRQSGAVVRALRIEIGRIAGARHVAVMAGVAHRPPSMTKRRRPRSGAFGSLSRRATSRRPIGSSPVSA